jgi:hypothetical protein
VPRVSGGITNNMNNPDAYDQFTTEAAIRRLGT